MAVLTGIRLDRFNEQNGMRNIDAKIEGIGFLIVKNEDELENLRIPVGGIVKVLDSGLMLERTANGYVAFAGGLKTVSLQISEMGVIDISSNEFSLDGGRYFLVKNDNTEAVELTIALAEKPSEYVTTLFQPGWNPEMVVKISASSSVSNLKYGR